MFSGGAAGLAASYSNAYNAALAANQQNYNNIATGYSNLMNQQAAGQSAVIGGYNQLSKDVMGTIQGSNEAAQTLINRSYAQQAAQAGQQLTAAGLNNTTVVQSLQRGITFDQQLASTNLANQFAQLQAQYQSTLGLAGLQYQGQAVNDKTALGVHQLDWMNSVQIPYPDASAYTQLLSYYGQQDQANKDRDLMSSLYDQMLQGSKGTAGGGFSGVYGTQPTPYYGSSTGGGSNYMPMGTSPGGALNPYASSYSGGYGAGSSNMLDYTSGYGNIYSNYGDYSWGGEGGGGSF
jgi:hypothetical protein